MSAAMVDDRACYRANPTVAALDAIETKYVGLGKSVEIVGMNQSSQRMLGRPSVSSTRPAMRT